MLAAASSSTDNPGCPVVTVVELIVAEDAAAEPLAAKGAVDEESSVLADPACAVVANTLVVTVAGSGPAGGCGGRRPILFTGFGFVGGIGASDMMQAAESEGQAAPARNESGLCL